VRSWLAWLLQIDEAVGELLVGDVTDRCNQGADTCRTAREPGRERDQHASVMLSGNEMLCRDAREVGDVLGEQRTPVRDRRRKYLRVRAPGHSELNDGAGVDTGRSKRIG